MEEWFSVSDNNLVDTPALLVYPERVKHNLALLKTQIDSVDRLRPHVKTQKSKEATLLTLEAGITKFKCATIAETEMLGMCNAPDVLLAYQPVGPKIDRFIKLIKKYPATKFSCLTDNYDAASRIDERAKLNHISIDVYIDLNVGMHRSGIVPDKAFELYIKCSSLSNIKVIGLHIYDGHIHDSDLDIRTQRCNEAFAPVDELIGQLKAAGYNPIVVAGGTPTFPIHAKRENVECSPGTFIYWDWGYQQAFKEQQFLPAALMMSRIVSLPDEKKICVDLGHKSVSAENVLDKRVTFLNSPELKVVSQSEEHLVLDAGENHTYKIGDVLYGLPYHICPTIALYERAIVIEDKKVAGEWKTIARDRKINC